MKKSLSYFKICIAPFDKIITLLSTKNWQWRTFRRHNVFLTSWSVYKLCLTSWRVCDVIMNCLTSWRFLWRHDTFLTLWRTFGVMHKYIYIYICNNFIMYHPCELRSEINYLLTYLLTYFFIWYLFGLYTPLWSYKISVQFDNNIFQFDIGTVAFRWSQLHNAIGRPRLIHL